jgi:hypothetical protein
MTSSSFVLPYLVLAATLMRALAVKSQFAAPSCGRCGRPLERRYLGEQICRCSSSG